MKTILVLATHPELAESLRVALDPERYRVVHRLNSDEAEPLLQHALVQVCVVGVSAILSVAVGMTAVAQALPELPVVLDHFGTVIGVGPYVGRERETFQTWRTDIRELSRCPNVSVKLGGMGMVMTGAHFHERAMPPDSTELARSWRPFVDTCIEAFGVERCMFESNFPVDKGMFSYTVLWNAFKRLSAGASAHEKAALFGTTAARFYRLPQPVQDLLMTPDTSA